METYWIAGHEKCSKMAAVVQLTSVSINFAAAHDATQSTKLILRRGEKISNL